PGFSRGPERGRQGHADLLVPLGPGDRAVHGHAPRVRALARQAGAHPVRRRLPGEPLLGVPAHVLAARDHERHEKQGLILCGVACLVFLGVIFVGAVLATINRVFAWLFAFGLINLMLLYLAVAIVCVIKAM